jgi:hypothetical protein
MEETTKRIIEVEVDLGKASGRLAEVTKEMDDLSKVTKSLKKENTDLFEQVRKGKKTWEEVSKQVGENSKKLAENEAKTKSLKAEQSTLMGQIAEASKDNRKYGDSFKELSAKLSDMKNAYRSLSKEQRDSDGGKKMLEEITALDAAMKEADASIGNFQRNVGNYPGAVKPLLDKLEALTKQMNDLQAAGKADSDEFKNLAQQATDVKTQLQSLQQSVDGIGQEMAPLKQQIKDATNELLQMKLRGEENTEQYRQMLEHLGHLKDTMDDAQREVKQMASDTSALNSVLDGAKLAAGGFSAALGIMNLVGDEESETAKEMAEAQKKLQSAIAITTGLQSVQNALQKESALMMGINKVQIWAAAKAQDAYTAATGRATVAQRVFNAVAKSNPYVLLAAAILSVVGAIAAFSAGSKEQEDQVAKTNEELQAQLEILKNLKSAYSSLYSEAIDLQSVYIEQLKTQGAETEKVRKAEDDLYQTRLSALEQEQEALSYDIAFLGEYQSNLMSNTEKLKEAKENYYKAVKDGQESLALSYKQEMDDLQALIAIDKERIDVVVDFQQRWNKLMLERQKTEAERTKADAEAAKKQKEDAEKAAKAAADRRKKREEEEKKYQELILTETQKAEDALNALIADQYEQRRAIEETDYNRKVAALQKSMEAEAKAHGTETALYKAYLSQQETLRLQHQQKMSDIAQDQLNDERELQKKAVQQLEADNTIYWQNRINEAIIKGQQTGQLELDMLKEKFETMQQLADESDEEFYARRLAAEKAYIDKKKSLAEAEKAIEKAKQEYIASIAGSISDLMETVAGDNKAMVKASKIVALAEVAIKQGVAIAEAVASSAAGDPYTYALRVAAAIASTVSAMATAIESINSVKLARGTSYVQGPGTETSDSVPAMLSKGEAVATAKANKMFPGVVGAMNDASVGIWSPMMSMLRNSGGAPAQVASPMQMSEVQMATAFRAAVEDLNLSVSVEEINRVGGQVKVVENLGAM